MMKVGPSESLCGQRLQTTTCCGTGDGIVVSDVEKARWTCQVGIRKASESESLLTCRNSNQVTSKPGCPFDPGMSLAGASIGQVVSGMEATRA